MSYIAKIYLNKMFKKEETLTLDGDMLKLKVYNVLNPLPLQRPPEKPYDHLEIMSEGKVICGHDIHFKIEWKGKVFDHTNCKTLEGQTVGLGDVYTCIFKNPGWKKGETHELNIKVIQDRPIEIKIERTIM
jgi:hypothetical protein